MIVSTSCWEGLFIFLGVILPYWSKKGGSMDSINDNIEKRILDCFSPAKEGESNEEVEFLTSMEIVEQLDSIFFLTKDDVSDVLFKNDFEICFVFDRYRWKVVRKVK